MPLPPAFLDELRARLPLSDVAAKRLRLIRAGREFKACCPFHKEKTPSFYINDDKQFYHCFGCGAHGDVIGFTMRMDNLSFPEAIELLAAQAGLAVPKDTPAERERYDLEKRLYLAHEQAAFWFEEQLFAPAGRDALNYLHGRGLSNESIRRFRLGYAPHDAQALARAMMSRGFKTEELLASGLIKKSEGREEFFSFFRNRVIFPVGDRRGRIVAFGGRSLGGDEPKYLNSPDHALFHKGSLLYGLSRARAAIQQNQPIIVVEGYMDVIAMAEAGYHGAVAPLGTALTGEQLVLLWKLLPPAEARDPSRDYSPILCFDGDGAGRRAAARAVERALPLLTAENTLRVAWLPEGEDPDSLLRQSGRSGIQAALEQARPMIDAIWELALEGRRLDTPEERHGFIKALRRRAGEIRDESLRKLYQSEIRQRLAAAFQWQPSVMRPASSSGVMLRKGAIKTGWRKSGGAIFSGPVSRRQPRKAVYTREKVLLAIMINHPCLFPEFGEELARIGFSNPYFEALRQHLVTILSSDSHETLDAAELYRHLSSNDAPKEARAALGIVLSEATYLYASFARPGGSPDYARRGWKSIWNKHLQELLQADLQAAKRRYAEDSSDASLARLLELRAQLEALSHDSALRELNGEDSAGTAANADF